ncbi:MAG TPA: DUF434 domain-containing protein [Opitutaceae bacterium]|jgi:hypothetical protein
MSDPFFEDAALFSPDVQPLLRDAVTHLCWLLSRGYAPNTAIKIVGDRFSLADRQRQAVARCACSDGHAAGRKKQRAEWPDLAARPLWLDGYNVLTTVEVALLGGVLLRGRDGTVRDVAGLHGPQRDGAVTEPALELLARLSRRAGSSEWVWYFDAPVSKSGRLRTQVEEIGTRAGLKWRVEAIFDPDPVLSATEEIVATADSAILDRCKRWFNLASEAVAEIPSAEAILGSDVNRT